MYPRECCRRCREFSGMVDYSDTGDCDSCFQDSWDEGGCDGGFRGCWKGDLLGSFLDILSC